MYCMNHQPLTNKKIRKIKLVHFLCEDTDKRLKCFMSRSNVIAYYTCAHMTAGDRDEREDMDIIPGHLDCIVVHSIH